MRRPLDGIWILFLGFDGNGRRRVVEDADLARREAAVIIARERAALTIDDRVIVHEVEPQRPVTGESIDRDRPHHAAPDDRVDAPRGRTFPRRPGIPKRTDMTNTRKKNPTFLTDIELTHKLARLKVEQNLTDRIATLILDAMASINHVKYGRKDRRYLQSAIDSLKQAEMLCPDKSQHLRKIG